MMEITAMTQSMPFRHFPLRVGLLALCAGLFQLPAQANEAALYGPTAPKGSAFVRLFNAGEQSTSAELGSLRFDDIAPRASSAFSFLPAGAYTATVAGKSNPVTLSPNQYHTLVNLPQGGAKLVVDPSFKNRQKALVRLQNLSSTPLSLKTQDGKTAVIEQVAPQAHGDREINPVKVGLALYQGDKKVSELPSVTLERGEVTGLFVTEAQGTLKPVWVKRVKDE
jgi:alginate O-acetyltransferase complex protein AlgF